MNTNLFDFRIDDKVALVTGGTKGIGYGIANGLAHAGARVVVVSRNQQDCDQVAEELSGFGKDAVGIATDITDRQQVEQLVKQVKDRMGRIDVLVNNAGTAMTKRAEDITEGEYDHLIDVDQKSVFLMSQAVGRVMIEQKGGKIINVASFLGLVGEKQILPYCVAKGGVIQMTRALAVEWSKHQITVNALCPGYVVTPMNRDDLEKEAIRDHILKNVPLRRFGSVEEMGAAVIFLASEAANYMTGQCLVVDGGWTAK